MAVTMITVVLTKYQQRNSLTYQVTINVSFVNFGLEPKGRVIDSGNWRDRNGG